MQNETFVISLGGSIIIPNEIDIDFLKSFRELILNEVKKGKKFAVVCGGGALARKYIESAKLLGQDKENELDWVGIASTRQNAELVRVMFGDSAFEKIIFDPDLVPNTDKGVLVGGGWKPGNSSDLASVHMAKSLNAKNLINLSNIDFVYNKDPKQFPDAEKIEKISWSDFRKILPAPENWKAGMSAPFDPVAAREAETLGLEVSILNGKNIENLAKYLSDEEFIGTKIS